MRKGTLRALTLILGFAKLANAEPNVQGEDASSSPQEPPQKPTDDAEAWLTGESTSEAAASPEQAAPNQGVGSAYDDTTKPRRKRYPHQLHVDASFVRTRIHYKMSFEYEVQQPDGFAEGRKLQSEATDGLGFLASVGWTWRFVGVGAEVLHSWGETAAIQPDAPPEFGVGGGTVRPSWTSVAAYADLRPFERWLSVRPGVGVGGVGISQTGTGFDAEGDVGLMPHIAVRLSVPVHQRFRVFAGVGARALVLSIWESGGSLLDWRLGVEMN